MDTINNAKYHGYAATNADDAFRILFENKYHTCIIHDEDHTKVGLIIKEVMDKLKEHNKTIPNINDQMLPSIYRWDAKDDNEKVCCHAAEINMGRFEEQAELLYVFSEPSYWVLTDPTARKPLSSKALATLATMGYMMTKEK